MIAEETVIDLIAEAGGQGMRFAELLLQLPADVQPHEPFEVLQRLVARRRLRSSAEVMFDRFGAVRYWVRRGA